jgi:nucleotide-binding universal stress UspA family protein
MRVLIAFDGSSGAEQAIALAGALHWPSEAKLQIAAVAEPVLPHYTGVRDMGPVPPPEIDPALLELRRREVSDAVARLRTNDRNVEGVVLQGWPATILADQAARFGADLMIAGSRGRGGLASLLLGSVSAAVVDNAPCPVLVARAAQVREVVLAVDGSGPAAVAELLVSTWPMFDGLELHVLSVADVMEPVQFGLAPPTFHRAAAEHASAVAEEKENHTRIAEETAARLRASGRRADAAIRTGPAADEIIAFATKTGADLVVMGSQGRTGLARMVLGSVARKVLNGSAASVLIVRAR